MFTRHHKAEIFGGAEWFRFFLSGPKKKFSCKMFGKKNVHAKSSGGF